MNLSKGNMYPFVTHTWNTIKGQCPDHQCAYCFMRRWKLKERRFDEGELKTNLGEGNFIFVGSSNDMFSASVPAEWIEQTLEHCRKFDNKYLFQSKNPKRFDHFIDDFPPKFILGTTLETNREDYQVSKAPTPLDRFFEIEWLSKWGDSVMVTIEPIMDFDLEIMVDWMDAIQPQWINIGADSKGHNLPEPSGEKVALLLAELQKNHKVVVKKNLKRLLGGGNYEKTQNG